MKAKIFILTLVLTGAMYLAADYLFVRYSKTNLIDTAKSGVSQSISLYRYINMADSFAEIKNVESLAKKDELVNAFNVEKWESAIKENSKDFSNLSEDSKKLIREIEQNIQVELNVINKMYDKNDAIFMVDVHGNVVAKNLDGIFRNKNLSKELLIQTALQGFSDRDVIKIVDKTYLVTAAPVIKNGKIIGAYCSADNVNSETAKEAASSLYDESLFNGLTKVYFGFFDKSALLGSTMPTELHESFKKFIVDNQELINKIDAEGSKKHEVNITLKNENFYTTISRHPSLSDTNDMFYIALVSKDKLLEPLKTRHGTLGLISFFIVLIGLIFSFILDEQFNKPVNKFMENMLEIINGNSKYRFSNDAEGTEGNLNQNANMMIAALLGEKTPEKEKLDSDQ
jgi:hypothetical protein